MWEHNKTNTFKCKFGHHYICASYFYILLYYRDHEQDSAIKAADLLRSMLEMEFGNESIVCY